MDAEDFQPPRHPDDRLWRHPAELAWEASMSGSTNPFMAAAHDTTDGTRSAFNHKTPARSLLGTVIISSLFGASLALVTVFATGVGTRIEPAPAASATTPSPSESATMLTRSTPGVAELAVALRPSVAKVRIENPDETSEASAIIWNHEGYLVTDAQSLEEASSVLVTLADGTTKAASVVGIDNVTKLAVLHIEASEVTPATITTDESVAVGDWAMAYGVSESGLPSISSGTISGVEERLSTQDGTLLYGMVRLGAPLPNGLAGGPLVSEHGDVVGVLLEGEAGSPFSWALPSGYVEKVVSQIIETGEMTHPWLGVEGERRSGGPTITRITPNSPAEQADLRVGDILLQVNGDPVVSMITLVTKIRSAAPGDTIAFTYERNGEVGNTDAVLAGR